LTFRLGTVRGEEVGVSELPSGTVTFLFTDLEDSTRLWEEHPEAMRLALARHDELVRSAIEASSGTVVKTTGDGFHAAFAVASDAVAAAVAAQLALGGERWGATGPLRVRMGVHTGAAELRDGDYYSSAVNRAARLMSVAHGGQIVVSSITSGLVPDGSVVFIDLGEHRLRDLAEPMRVVQVTHPDLPREFPPIRSLDALPGNMPVQLTSFVGREEELAGLARALEEWRLVTLTGTGGVGKSRLAVQIAAEVVPQFRDGAWLCELAVADGETMGQVVAAALGVSQRFGMSWAESVSDYLRPMELLLVLDNCEHLIGPASDLAEQVLRECPSVRILTTSREGLGVAGEHVWPLRSLPVPNAMATDIAASDAVTLFTERAQAARASFTLDVSNAAAVAEICRRLDGIPLAIELAAARVVSMTASEISGLLDERFRLLTGGRRTSVERHQTLRAAVDWSYSLLTEQERIVFDRLGVFVGSFDAPAARTVVSGDGIEDWDVLDALTELVAKSMIVAEDAAGDTTRYQMLETLGQYARERLDGNSDTDHWRRRHAEYFALWAEDAGPGLLGPDELVWRARENAELDNLRAAVMWALDRPEPDDVGLALRIVGALAHECTVNPAAGIGTLAERALPHVAATSPELSYAVIAAAAQHQANLGNYPHAQELARRAIGDGVPPGVLAPADAHGTLAIGTVMLGDAQGALAIALDAARRLERDDPDSPAALHARSLVVVFAAAAGDPIARPEAERALRHARETASPTALATAVFAYAYALVATDPAAALAALDESIALSRQGASASNLLAAALVEAAGLRVRVGDLPHAARDLREGIERDHQAGTRASIYVGAWWGIEILIGLERLEQAAVFDGIVSTSLPAEHRTANISPGVGERELAHQRDAIADARATYGPEHYDAAFQTGAAMTYDQAVEYILQVLGDVINETSHTRAVS
jgi:predicted ATPase/class 3 adenylate cyclase